MKFDEKEVTSPLKAIRLFCLNCADSYVGVKECPSGTDSKYPCPLYSFRFGKNPYRKSREYTEEELDELRNRMSKARSSKV